MHSILWSTASVVSFNYMRLYVNYSLFKLRKVSTWSPIRLALFWEQIFPAAEKICSEGVDVAGMHRRDLASFDSVGKRTLFSLHHMRGSSFLDLAGSAKYIWTSFLTIWIFWSAWVSSSPMNPGFLCFFDSKDFNCHPFTLLPSAAATYLSFRSLGSRAVARVVSLCWDGVQASGQSGVWPLELLQDQIELQWLASAVPGVSLPCSMYHVFLPA